MNSLKSKRQTSPLLLLLLTVSFSAILFYAAALAVRREISGLTLIILFAPLGFYGVYSAILFSILYPLGRLNKYVYDQVSGPESPFADERMPTQIIAPKDPIDAK
jgi:hypothetical protein